jgi:hypothetical protein
MPDTIVGSGIRPNVMDVTDKGEARVYSSSNPGIFHSSYEEQLAFNAIMPSFSAAAGDYVFYLKNTSTTHLIHIDSIEFHSVESVHWKIFQCTGTAAGGTDITANLLNLGGNNTAAAVSMGGGATITGLTIGTQVGTHRTQATGEASMTFGGALFLGSGQAIVVEYDTGTTGLCEIDCIFNYKVKL